MSFSDEEAELTITAKLLLRAKITSVLKIRYHDEQLT
jgi:hypothetical protein